MELYYVDSALFVVFIFGDDDDDSIVHYLLWLAFYTRACEKYRMHLNGGELQPTNVKFICDQKRRTHRDLCTQLRCRELARWHRISKNKSSIMKIMRKIVDRGCVFCCPSARKIHSKLVCYCIVQNDKFTIYYWFHRHKVLNDNFYILAFAVCHWLIAAHSRRRFPIETCA